MTDASRTSEEMVWCLAGRKINEFQVASIDRLIDLCGAAHYVNIEMRINGRDEVFQADWLKHMKRVVDPIDQSQLLAFYDVRTKDELIERLYRHIERLQEKLPQTSAGAERSAPREG